MKSRKIYAVVIILAVAACALILASNRFAKQGAEEAAVLAEAEKKAQKQEQANTLLELTYTQEGENTSTTTTVKFYKDGTFRCTGLASSMYVIDYTAPYQTKDGLMIERVEKYEAKATDEALPVLEVMGLPDVMPINITHLVETTDQGATLTIQGDLGDGSEPTVLGVFELTAEQLQQISGD